MLSRLTKRSVQVHSLTIFIGVLVFLLDQLTKYLVYRFIPSMDQAPYVYPYGGIGVFKNILGIEFSINFLTNKGAAWGVLDDYQFPLVLLRIALIGSLLIYLFIYNKRPSWQIPLALIAAGALGNVIDYFVYGHVIDMFHLVLWGYEFPVFNVADSAITIGIVSLMVLSYLIPT